MSKISKFALVIVLLATILIATAYLAGYFPGNKTTAPPAIPTGC